MRIFHALILLIPFLVIDEISGQEASSDTIFSGYVDYPFANTFPLKELTFDQIEAYYFQADKITWPTTEAINKLNEFEPDESWSYWVHSYLTDTTKNLYHDDELKKIIRGNDRLELFSSKDTVVPYGGYWEPPYYKVVLNETIFQDIKGIRVKQICIWHPKNSKLEFKILAYAPIVYDYDENGNYKGMRPIAWAPVKATDIKRSILLSKSSVPFVATTRMLLFKKRDEAQLDSANWQPIFSKVLLNSVADAIIESDKGTPLNKINRLKLIAPRQDTIINNGVDSTDKESKYLFIERPFDWWSLKNINTIIRWHWDTDVGSLNYQVLGWAPMQAIYDERDNLLYHWPLFYYIST